MNEFLTPQQIERCQAFQAILDQEPKHTEQHEDGYDYIPVSAIEDDLAEVFAGLYQITILNSKVLFHAIQYDVRISYFHPVTGMWIARDGAGSVSIYGNMILEGTDVSRMHIVATPEMATPLAYAEAIKNAAKKIGKRFGSDLNRKFDSKSRKAKPSAFDVVPTSPSEIKTIHDANKAFTAKVINFKQLKEIKAIADADGNVSIPDSFFDVKDQETAATIRKSTKK